MARYATPIARLSVPVVGLALCTVGGWGSPWVPSLAGCLLAGLVVTEIALFRINRWISTTSDQLCGHLAVVAAEQQEVTLQRKALEGRLAVLDRRVREQEARELRVDSLIGLLSRTRSDLSEAQLVIAEMSAEFTDLAEDWNGLVREVMTGRPPEADPRLPPPRAGTRPGDGPRREA
ncbi:hypothetical protein AB0K43_11795 [Kitasatospora sp. NPDC049258]|uniref:hypothetical protein n=1 Tax=Kitasatospora sp. NPDC049258 TaxID=3155394 RepID=UPI00341B6229